MKELLKQLSMNLAKTSVQLKYGDGLLAASRKENDKLKTEIEELKEKHKQQETAPSMPPTDNE